MEEKDIRIVILQRGWVMVGEFSKVPKCCYLTNASVIRVWGTTKGLGEIAVGGPTPSTKLDKIGRVEFHYKNAIAIVKCDASKWENIL